MYIFVCECVWSMCAHVWVGGCVGMWGGCEREREKQTWQQQLGWGREKDLYVIGKMNSLHPTDTPSSQIHHLCFHWWHIIHFSKLDLSCCCEQPCCFKSQRWEKCLFCLSWHYKFSFSKPDSFHRLSQPVQFTQARVVSDLTTARLLPCAVFPLAFLFSMVEYVLPMVSLLTIRDCKLLALTASAVIPPSPLPIPKPHHHPLQKPSTSVVLNLPNTATP